MTGVDAAAFLSRVQGYLQQRQYLPFTTQAESNAIMRARAVLINLIFDLRKELALWESTEAS